MGKILRTRIFEFGPIASLSRTTGISDRSLYDIKNGHATPGLAFVRRVLDAFTGYEFEDFFYVEDDGLEVEQPMLPMPSIPGRSVEEIVARYASRRRKGGVLTRHNSEDFESGRKKMPRRGVRGAPGGGQPPG